jgi:hypothetical protein
MVDQINSNPGIILIDNSNNDDTVPGTQPGITTRNFDEIVSPQNFDAQYYQFTIETFGWFNIDILMKDLAGVKESSLFVRIQGEYREKVQVYLVIPSVKVFVQAGPAENERFAFQYKDGRIFLPQGIKAWILAITESGSGISYALQEFMTSTSHEIDVALTKSSVNDFNSAIKRLSADSININVTRFSDPQKVARDLKELKEVNRKLKEAEHLKPVSIDCDCNSH